MQSSRTRTWATNGLFGAFILALFGWGLLHAWAVQAGAARALHALIAIPGLAICAIVLYRYARHWPSRPASLYRERRHGVGLDGAAATGASLLWIAGGGLALALSVDSPALLAPAALALGLLPWTRLPVCRDHFFISSAAAGAGAVLGFVLAGDSMQRPHYPVSALFCLCLAASITVFVILVHGGRRDRMSAAGSGWMSD